jgi:hypothetical protein
MRSRGALAVDASDGSQEPSGEPVHLRARERLTGRHRGRGAQRLHGGGRPRPRSGV